MALHKPAKRSDEQPKWWRAGRKMAALCIVKERRHAGRNWRRLQWAPHMRRQRGEAVNPPDLRNKIIEAFEQYRDWFVRPFGEGSQRWALAGDFA